MTENKLIEYSSDVRNFAGYFSRTLPSAVDLDEVLRAEFVLNDMRQECRSGGYDQNICEAIKEALSLAGDLSRKIKAGDDDLSRLIIDLGEALDTIIAVL